MITPEQHRAAYVRALRDVADAIETHPALPVERFPAISVGMNSEEELRAAAVALGTEPEWNRARTHFRAERTFGRITYRCVYITPSAMDAHNRRMEVPQATIDVLTEKKP